LGQESELDLASDYFAVIYTYTSSVVIVSSPSNLTENLDRIVTLNNPKVKTGA